jgi:hypothetical protein
VGVKNLYVIKGHVVNKVSVARRSI